MTRRPTPDRLSWTLLVVLSRVLVVGFAPSTVKAGDWHAAVGGGGNFNFSPEAVGRGWVLFDSVGTGVVGNGDLHLYWNTDKILWCPNFLGFISCPLQPKINPGGGLSCWIPATHFRKSSMGFPLPRASSE
jgi:hypothetical protein